MNLKFKGIKKFQEGGAAPAPGPENPEMTEQAGAPAGGGEDPLMQIAQAAMQALQSQDCNMAMQVCEAFVQMIQQAQGGGAEQAPEAQGEPVYRAGGRLIRRIKK